MYRYLATTLSPDDTVLDVGAGNARRVAALPGQSVALDIAHTPVVETQEAVRGDGRQLPFTDDAFDYVVSNQVLEHVPQKEAFVGELSRVLDPSGELVIAFPNRYWPLDEHDTVPFLSMLPRAVGVPASKHLLPERRHTYYERHLHPISPFRARSILCTHFETVEFVTVDLVRRLDLRGTDWERPKRLLSTLPTENRLFESFFECCATYLAYRCVDPLDGSD